jgi:hypothetical protein
MASTHTPLIEVTWAHHSSEWRGLSFSFGVRCDDQRLGAQIELLLGSLHQPGPTTHWYSMVSSDPHNVSLYLDDVPLASCATVGDAIEWLLWDINRAVAAASNEHLLFHAGGVELNGTAFLLPAPSGSGKSTLVTGLVERGAGYLSDELIAVEADGSLAHPYPKPIAIKPGSFGVLDHLRPEEVDGFATEEWYLRPESVRSGAVGRPCLPAVCIVPRFDAGGRNQLTRLSSTELFLALTVNSVNLAQHGEAGTKVLGELAQRCLGFELEFADLNEACRLIDDLAGLRTAPSAS